MARDSEKANADESASSDKKNDVSRETPGRQDNHRKTWADYRLVARRTAWVKAPGNKSFLLVAEARLLEGSTAIQIAVGRANPDDVLAYDRSNETIPPPIPKFMRLFLEDIPMAQKLQSEVFDEAFAVYKEIEQKRIDDRAARESADLRRRIAATESWKKPLLRIEQEIKNSDKS